MVGREDASITAESSVRIVCRILKVSGVSSMRMTSPGRTIEVIDSGEGLWSASKGAPGDDASNDRNGLNVTSACFPVGGGVVEDEFVSVVVEIVAVGEVLDGLEIAEPVCSV